MDRFPKLGWQQKKMKPPTRQKLFVFKVSSERRRFLREFPDAGVAAELVDE